MSILAVSATVMMLVFTGILMIPIARAIEFKEQWIAEVFLILLGWSIVYAIFFR